MLLIADGLEGANLCPERAKTMEADMSQESSKGRVSVMYHDGEGSKVAWSGHILLILLLDQVV